MCCLSIVAINATLYVSVAAFVENERMKRTAESESTKVSVDLWINPKWGALQSCPDCVG